MEQWLAFAIHHHHDYSFNMKEIPNKTFLSNFKKRYEGEFLKLQTNSYDSNYSLTEAEPYEESGVSTMAHSQATTVHSEKK